MEHPSLIPWRHEQGCRKRATEQRAVRAPLQMQHLAPKVFERAKKVVRKTLAPTETHNVFKF
eukprot:204603-Rhodomonas_salina.1